MVQTVKTDNGVASFRNLAAGTYYLQETRAPDGYALDNTVWTVTVTTSGGQVSESQIGVTLKDSTNIVAQLWKSVLNFFSGNDYEQSEALPVTISDGTAEQRTAVLKMVNIPQVTGLSKLTANALYDGDPDHVWDYLYVKSMSYTNLAPETESVEVLFSVNISGGAGASLTGYSDKMTAPDGTEIPVELVYPEEMP